MPAPAATDRQTPSGIYLENGHSTKITFARDPDISFWEKTVTPPGIDGGDAVETTNMHTVRWRSKKPRTLKTLTDMTTTVQYDPALYNQIVDLINVEDTITVEFPDGSTLAFYGFLQKFEPGELSEGAPPEATITIVPTNTDLNASTEQAPVLTSVAGT